MSMPITWNLVDELQDYHNATVRIGRLSGLIQVWRSSGDRKITMRLRVSNLTLAQTELGGRYNSVDDAKAAATMLVYRLKKILSEIE